MDNTQGGVDELITSIGYRNIHLSPELNPIEQFWTVVNNKIKRGVFFDNKYLKTRIADACNNVPIQNVKAVIQLSCNQFEKCRNKETSNHKNPLHRKLQIDFTTNRNLSSLSFLLCGKLNLLR